MDTFENTIEKLVNASQKSYPSPYGDMNWPDKVDLDAWYTAPELLSIYGTEIYEDLSEAQKKQLSFYEAVNFYCINVHGEKLFIEGAVQRLYTCHASDVSGYLHHFINEENKHLEYFGRFCNQYAGKIYGVPESMPLQRRYEEGEEDFTFFARVLISEDIIEAYNGVMAFDKRLHPLARQINYLHHCDEARHRLFGRVYLVELFKRYSPKWSPGTLQNIRNYLKNSFDKIWVTYYNPEMYTDTGLPNAVELSRQTYRHPVTVQYRQKMSANCIRFFVQNGILGDITIA